MVDGTTIGILALQGDFPAHASALARRGVPARLVRRPQQLTGLCGLVLPGGESSVMWKLAESESLLPALERAAHDGLPVLATCAGLILLAREVTRPTQPSLGLLDVTVERNGYGRQIHSGVHRLEGASGFPDCEGVFIRAPRIVSAGSGTTVLARWNDDAVLVREGHLIGACFHPELSEAHPALDLFLELAKS